MKTNRCTVLVAFVVVVPMLYASHTRSSANQGVQGMVVSVQKHEVQSPGEALTTPTDAPLSSQYFAYDVSVRVDCQLYVGRYETPFDYLPSAFSPDHAIQMRLTEHVLYFDLPNNPEMRMAIVHHAAESDTTCRSNR